MTLLRPTLEGVCSLHYGMWGSEGKDMMRRTIKRVKAREEEKEKTGLHTRGRKWMRKSRQQIRK